MKVTFEENNEIRGISIIYNEKEREYIMQLKDFFDFHQHQIKVRTMEGTFTFISVINIYYVEAVDGRCYIYGENSIYTALDDFQRMKEILRVHGFLQCNKQQMMNVYHLKSLEIYKDCQRIATLDNGEIILVSRKYKKEIDEYKQLNNPF